MVAQSQRPLPMTSWQVWFMATRPWSLTISVIPIMLATALAWAYGSVSIPFGILMLLTSVLTHIGCNLTNDYFDNESGVDLVQNEGQGGMLQDGHLSSRDLRIGMIISFALALLFGVPIIMRLGWIGLVFALVGAGVAFLYTGGPWPLAYNRMGEISVFVSMGLVMVGGAFYVHTDTITWPAMILAANVGLYAAAILHSNNMRDIVVDEMHKKHTLANTFGWAWGVNWYIILIVIPLSLTGFLVIWNLQYWPLLATMLLMIPTLQAIQHMTRAQQGELTSAIVGRSTKLHMGYSAIATLAFLIIGVVN